MGICSGRRIRGGILSMMEGWLFLLASLRRLGGRVLSIVLRVARFICKASAGSSLPPIMVRCGVRLGLGFNRTESR